MKNLVCVLIFFLLCCTATGQKSRHVILISIDGFRPDFYLDSTWKADNIRSLMGTGVYALGVKSVFPSLTYPSHTTIITGVLPVKHGIFYNAPFISSSKKDSIYWKFNSIQSTTLWEKLKKNGLITAAIKWPVSAGAPVDYIIPDVGRVGTNTYNYSFPNGIIEAINKDVFGISGSDLTFFQNHEDTNSAKILCYLIKNYKPGFMAIHLLGVDHSEHLEGRYGKLVKRSVELADRSVGMIMKAVHEAGITSTTSIIVTGDHGFESVNTEVNPNVWLRENGVNTNVSKNKKSAYFYPAGGSAFLYVGPRHSKRTIRKVSRLLAKLPFNEKQYFSIISKENLIKSGADPKASFALNAKNGAVFGSKADGKGIIAKKTITGAHGYFPDSSDVFTGFVANGAGIPSGIVIKQMNLTDIAPFISDLFGINFPINTSKVHFMNQLLK